MDSFSVNWQCKQGHALSTSVVETLKHIPTRKSVTAQRKQVSRAKFGVDGGYALGGLLLLLLGGLRLPLPPPSPLGGLLLLLGGLRLSLLLGLPLLLLLLGGLRLLLLPLLLLELVLPELEPLLLPIQER